MNRFQRGPWGFLASLGDEPEGRWAALGTGVLLAGLGLGLAIRAYLAASTAFPINDGALFYDFVRGVAEVFPALPEHVPYNGIDIPFAYPPLSFWAAASLNQLGLPALDIVHYLPIAMNAAYVLLFAGLLLRNGHSRLFTGLALLFLVTTLRSFEWLVMGGGLSRGLGSLLFLLTLLAAGLPDPSGERVALPLTPLVLAGLTIAGAILSHLEWGLLAAASFTLSRALAAPSVGRLVTDNLTAGATAFLAILPWLAWTIGTHGLGPFLAAGGTSHWQPINSALSIIALAVNNRANLFLFLGGAVLLARRDLFWPLFLVLCLFLTPRHAQTPLVLGLAVISAQGVLAFASLLGRTRLRPGQAALAAGAMVAVVLAWQVYRDWKNAGPFRPLPEEAREAMAWVRSTHPGATFAVLTEPGWWYDASAEWFPTLAGARSVTTVQGREWLPDQAYARWVAMSMEVKAAETCPETLAALKSFGRAQYVWAETKQGCFRPPAYRPVYRNGQIVIFEARQPAR